MHLKLMPGNKTHLSHFHSLVSAYETTNNTVRELEQSIRDAIKKAKETKEMIVVEQDSLQHIFVVFASGAVSLYREIGVYEVCDE